MSRLVDPAVLRGAGTVVLVAGALALIYLLRTILLLLVFSVVFAYLIFPLVRLAERVRRAHADGARRRDRTYVSSAPRNRISEA